MSDHVAAESLAERMVSTHGVVMTVALSGPGGSEIWSSPCTLGGSFVQRSRTSLIDSPRKVSVV